MNFFSKIIDVVKSAFTRFASIFILCFAAAMCFSFSIHFSELSGYKEYTGNADEIFLTLGCDFIWAAAFAYLLQLIWEKYNISFKFHSLVKTAIPFLLCIPFYFVWNDISDNHVATFFFSSFGAIILFSFYLICNSAKEHTGSILVFSTWIAEIIGVAIGGALTLIYGAVSTLLFVFNTDVESAIFMGIWIFAGLFVSVGVFVISSTRTTINNVISKIIKVLFVYIELPAYGVLMVVLYAYLIKSLVTFTYPSGSVNGFVTAATVIFLELYVILLAFDNAATRFFKRFGGFILLPFVIIQLIGFVIRLDAYGFTTERYLNFIYILFSVVALGIILYQETIKKSFAFTKYLFALAGIFVLVISLPGIGVIDFTTYSMKNNIETVYKNHGLYQEGVIISDGADEKLTIEDKKLVSTSWRELSMEEQESYRSEGKKNFEEIFGFTLLSPWEYDEDAKESSIPGFSIDTKRYPVVDIRGYSSMKQVQFYKWYDVVEREDERKVSIDYEGKELDISEEINALRTIPSSTISSPLIIEKENGKYKFIITFGYSSNYSDSLEGYLLVK